LELIAEKDKKIIELEVLRYFTSQKEVISLKTNSEAII